MNFFQPSRGRPEALILLLKCGELAGVMERVTRGARKSEEALRGKMRTTCLRWVKQDEEEEEGSNNSCDERYSVQKSLDMLVHLAFF